MKIHLAVSASYADGRTMTTTLCGRMNAASSEGMNSTEKHEGVTCAFCKKILTMPTHWRYGKFVR